MKSLLFFLGLALATYGSASAADVGLAVDKAQSRVEILVKATVDSFTGTLVDYQPVIRVDHDTGTVVSADVSFAFADVKTGKPDRDEQMHTWEDSARFPTGDFKLLSLTPTSEGRFTATGTLTFHGVTRELSFPITITTDRRLFAIDGEAVVDTRTFDLPVIRKFGLLKVDPLVKVRFHLQGKVLAN